MAPLPQSKYIQALQNVVQRSVEAMNLILILMNSIDLLFVHVSRSHMQKLTEPESDLSNWQPVNVVSLKTLP